MPYPKADKYLPAGHRHALARSRPDVRGLLRLVVVVFALTGFAGPGLAQDNSAAALQRAYIQGIQEALTAHGFQPGPASGELDAATRAAIKAYQKQAGLPVDGKPSASLLDHIKFAEPQVTAGSAGRDPQGRPPTPQKPPPPPVQRPDPPPTPPAKPEAAADPMPPASQAPKPDPMISDIQRRLAERGYDPGPANGQRSEKAREAAQEFQRDAGLAETGVLNQALLDALKTEGQSEPPAEPASSPPPPLKFSNETAPSAPPAESLSNEPPKPEPPPAPAPRQKPPPPAPPPPPPPRAEAPDEQRARDRGAEAGELEVFMAWGSTHDLDVFVRCPSGGTVTATEMQACGGRLDLDTNGSDNEPVIDPVEHVVFPNPQKGAYRIDVANCEHNGRPEKFRLWVVYRGKTIAQREAAIPVDPTWGGNSCGSPQAALRFNITD